MDRESRCNYINCDLEIKAFCEICKEPFCENHIQLHGIGGGCLGMIELYVKCFSGKSFKFSINQEAKIYEIISVIEQNYGFQFRSGKVFYENTLLLNKSALSTYGIPSQSELSVIFKVKTSEQLEVIFDRHFEEKAIDSYEFLVIFNLFDILDNILCLSSISIVQIGGELSFFYCLIASCKFRNCFYYGDIIIPEEILNKINSNLLYSVSQINNDSQFQTSEIYIIFDQERWDYINEKLLLPTRAIAIIKNNIKYTNRWSVLYKKPFFGYKFLILFSNSEVTHKNFQLNEIFIAFNDISSRAKYGYVANKIAKRFSYFLRILGYDSIELDASNATVVKFFLEQKKNKLVNAINQDYQLGRQEHVLEEFLLLMTCKVTELYIDSFIPLIDFEHKHEKKSILMSIFQLKMIPYGYLDIVYNFRVSVLGATLIIDYILNEENEKYIESYFLKQKWIYKINKNPLNILELSYKNILKRNKVLSGITTLDENEASSDIQVENIITSSLILDEIISIPNEIPLISKTLLGGYIGIDEGILEMHIFQPLGLAKFILAYRHELAYRKWLLYGSNNDYTALSLEEIDDNSTINESSYFLDTLVAMTPLSNRHWISEH